MAGGVRRSYTPHPETRRPDAIAVHGGNKTALGFRHLAVAVTPVRETAFEHPGAVNLHCTRPPQHLKLLVKGKKGLQQVLFRPKPQLVQDCVSRVVGGKKDIVDVDQHAGLQFWQNLQVELHHIAADGYDVAGIDKKNVSAVQAVEEVEINVLDGFWDLLYRAAIGEPLREGIDRKQLSIEMIAFAVFLDGRGQYPGAVSGAYFNHP